MLICEIVKDTHIDMQTDFSLLSNKGLNSVEWHWPLAAALLSPACPEGGALCHCGTAGRRTADRSGWPDAGRTSPPAARTAEISLSLGRLVGYTAQISHFRWWVVKETSGLPDTDVQGNGGVSGATQEENCQDTGCMYVSRTNTILKINPKKSKTIRAV